MAYAVLEVELVGRYEQLEQTLNRADAAMRKAANKSYTLGFKLNPRIFDQINNVRRMLRTIGTVTANVEIRLNGSPLQIERDVGKVAGAVDKIGAAADTTNAKIELLNKRVKGMGGTAGLAFNSKDLLGGADPFDHLQARAIRFQQEFAKNMSPAAILKAVGGVASAYEKQNIDASAIRAAIPELRELLALQSQIKANRLVKIDVAVDKEGKAYLKDLSLQLSGTGQSAAQLEAALRRLDTIKRQLRQAGLSDTSVLGRDPKTDAQSLDAYAAAARRALAEQRELNRERERSANVAARERSELAQLRVSAREIATQTGASLPALSGVRSDQIQQLVKWLAQVNTQVKELQVLSERLSGKGFSAFVQSVSQGSGTVEQKLDRIKAKLAEIGNVKAPSSKWSPELGAYQKQLEESAKATKELGNQTGSLGQKAAQVWNTITRWAIGYFLVSQLINAFQALKYAIIDFNALLETSRIALTTMLGGSAQQADILLGKLKQFAKFTPFQFADLVPLTQRLVVLGVVAKKNVQDLAIPALTAIGNAVSALGGGSFEIERVVRALGQMSTKGKISAEEVSRQLGEIGIDAPRYLAEAANKTVPEIFELMKKGALDGKKGVQAILYGMANDPLYKDMMDKQSRTFTGAMSNIKDSLTDLLATAFLPTFQSLSKGLQRLQAILNTKAFAQFAGGVSDFVLGPLRLIVKVAAWVVGELLDKLPFILAVLAGVFGPRMLAMLTAWTVRMTLAGIAAARAGVSAALAWAAANVPMTVAIALVIALIAAYRKFEVVQQVVDAVVTRVLEGFQVMATGVAYFLGVLSNFAARTVKLFGVGDFVLDRLGQTGQDIKDWRNGIIDAFSMEGAENVTLTWTQNLIDGWETKGKERMHAFAKGDILKAIGLRDVMDSINREIAGTAPYKPDLSGLKMPADLDLNKPNGKAALAAYKKQLQEAAKAYDELAKSAEKSAKRQLDALKGVRDLLRDIFGSIQDELAKYGILTSPLDAVIARIEKLANLGPRMVSTVSTAMDRANGFRLNAAESRQMLANINSATNAKTSGTLNGTASAGAGIGLSGNASAGAGVGGGVSLYGTASAGSGVSRGGTLNGTASAGAGIGSHRNMSAPMFPAPSAVSSAVMPASTALASVQATGKAVSSTMLTSIIQEFNDKSPHSLGASCADVASKVMERIGQGLKYSARADVLEQNAIKAGWRPVKLGTPGSLTFQGQAGNPYYGKVSGMHVGVGIGGDRVMSSSNFRTSIQSVKSLYAHNGRPRAYLPASGGNIGAFMANAGGMGDAAQLAASGNEGGTSVVEEMVGLLNDLKLSKLSPLPPEWGETVKEGADTTARFKVQMLLANTATQTLLKSALGEEGFAKLAGELRAATNDADAMIGRLRAGKAISDELRGLAARSRARGKEGDPFFALDERRRPGGDLFYANQGEFNELQRATVRDALDNQTRSVRNNTEALRNRRKVLESGAAFVKAGSFDEYNYARAVELRGKEVEFWSSQEVKALSRRASALERFANASSLAGFAQGPIHPGARSAALQAREIRTGLSRDAQTAARVAREGYDYERAVERTNDMAKAREEANRRTVELRAQLPLVASLSSREFELNQALESQAFYFEQLNRLRDLGHSNERSRTLAAELTSYHNLNRELERTVALSREVAAANGDVNAANARSTNLAGLYGSTAYGSAAQLRGLRYEDALAPLRRRAESGEFSGAGQLENYRTLVEAAKQKVDAEMRGEAVADKASSIYSAQNDFLATQNIMRQKGLDLAGLLTDSSRYQNDLNLEINKRQGTTNELTGRELEIRLQILAMMRETSALEHQKRVGDLRDQIEAAGINGTDSERDAFMSKRTLDRMAAAIAELEKQQSSVPMVSTEWGRYQAQIEDASTAMERAKEIFDLDALLQKTRETTQGMRDAFKSVQNIVADGFDRMATSGGNAMDRILGGVAGMVAGIADYLLKLAQQILANYIVMQIFSAILPGFGDFMGSMQTAANTLPTFGGGGGNGRYSNAGNEVDKTGSLGSRDTASAGGGPVQVTIQNDFSGIKDASEADRAAQVVGRQVSGAFDSRRTMQRDSSDFVSGGFNSR